MKTLIKLAVTTSTILLANNTLAAKPLSDSQLLGQCKNLAASQLEDVKKVKVAKMKNTRGTFEAKLRVSGANDRGMFLCTIERGQEANIVRLDAANARVASVK